MPPLFLLELHVAHIDHGWRPESKAEAEMLSEELKVLNLPFYLKTLSLSDFQSGNAEEQGRRHRLEFFEKIYSEIGAQALLLGHHAGDQSETVLKRVFEGASLFSLSGLAAESVLCGMQIWRPLLGTEKKQLIEWLSKRNLNYIEDSTNKSLKFLRGKMRQQLLPMITDAFGKEIGGNLCRLGDESKEIKEYFNDLNKPILKSIRKGSLDLNPFLPMPLIQIKFLIRGWLEQERISVSRQIVDGIAEALKEGAHKKIFNCKEGELNINKGVIGFNKL